MSNETVELIEKFLSGTLSGEEMHRLLHAYQQKQISEEQFDEYYAGKWKDAARYPSSLANESKERTWKHEAYTRKCPNAAETQSRWVSYAGVAAVAILTFYAGSLAQPS